MKTYTFIIGSQDDFESLDELMDWFEIGCEPPQAHRPHSPNASAHEFEAPDDCDEETVTLIGRGIAFSNDWCMDHTFSFLIHGALETKSEADMIQRGIDARESQKKHAREMSEAQTHDPFELGDENDEDVYGHPV